MSVVIETTLGDITVDLFLKERPQASLNFLKLCKMKYYNYSLFHTISRGFIAQTGDPTGSRNGGESIYGVLEGPLKRYFESEKTPRIKHTHNGLVSFVGNEDGMIGSQFFITLGGDLTYLDEKHCVFGEVMEGLDVLELFNETICDNDNRPYKDVRITHTVILDDPFPDLKYMRELSRSPSPSKERLQGGRIGADEEIDDTEGKTIQEITEMLAEREAKARATILEMVGDLPDADMAPPENVLFVCKLNPITSDDDLEIIFSRFGKINSCEVIRDHKTRDSLQYAFVEFAERKACEDAYFKMDNVLIDDRRIHVDFSQSVSKVKWHGKGRGVTMYDDKGRKAKDEKNELGQGKYKKYEEKEKKSPERKRTERRRDSPGKDRNGRKKDSPERHRDDRYKEFSDWNRNRRYNSSEYYREKNRRNSPKYHRERSSSYGNIRGVRNYFNNYNQRRDYRGDWRSRPRYDYISYNQRNYHGRGLPYYNRYKSVQRKSRSYSPKRKSSDDEHYKSRKRSQSSEIYKEKNKKRETSNSSIEERKRSKKPYINNEEPKKYRKFYPPPEKRSRRRDSSSSSIEEKRKSKKRDSSIEERVRSRKRYSTEDEKKKKRDSSTSSVDKKKNKKSKKTKKKKKKHSSSSSSDSD